MDLAQYTIPALTGGLGWLIATYVNFGIDGRRERQKNRKELIERCRTILASPPELSEFRKLAIYFQLKPYLSETSVKTIEGDFDEFGGEAISIVMINGRTEINPYASMVLNELAILERKWGLL